MEEKEVVAFPAICFLKNTAVAYNDYYWYVFPY